MKKETLYKILSVVAVVAGAELLLLGGDKLVGWLVWSVIFCGFFLIKTTLSRDFQLLLISVGTLGIVPITTDVSLSHMAAMGLALTTAIGVPMYLANKKAKIIAFPLGARNWPIKYYAYVVFAAAAAYMLLPFYLASTGSYHNWDAPWDWSHIVRLFIGTNGLGIWDELFFIGVCLALLRRHLPFFWANVVQATLWASFLYELGFHGWGPIAIFFFAIIQGYLFKNIQSILFIVVVHLTVDLMLFLSLLHLHNPDYLRIFLTAPF